MRHAEAERLQFFVRCGQFLRSGGYSAFEVVVVFLEVVFDFNAIVDVLDHVKGIEWILFSVGDEYGVDEDPFLCSFSCVVDSLVLVVSSFEEIVDGLVFLFFVLWVHDVGESFAHELLAGVSEQFAEGFVGFEGGSCVGVCLCLSHG